VYRIGPLAPALAFGDPVTLPETLATRYRRELVTVAQFVAESPSYDADRCVERLAATGQLRLLAGGCDRALLHLLLQRSQPPTPDTSGAPIPQPQTMPVEVK